MTTGQCGKVLAAFVFYSRMDCPVTAFALKEHVPEATTGQVELLIQAMITKGHAMEAPMGAYLMTDEGLRTYYSA